jgi:hypothetical protein
MENSVWIMESTFVFIRYIFFNRFLGSTTAHQRLLKTGGISQQALRTKNMYGRSGFKISACTVSKSRNPHGLGPSLCFFFDSEILFGAVFDVIAIMSCTCKIRSSQSVAKRFSIWSGQPDQMAVLRIDTVHRLVFEKSLHKVGDHSFLTRSAFLLHAWTSVHI